MLYAVAGLLGVFATVFLGFATIVGESIGARAQAQYARMDTQVLDLASAQLSNDLAVLEHNFSAASAPDTALTSSALTPLASTPLCDESAPCGLTGSATYTVVAGTDETPSVSGNELIANLQRASGAWERRVSVDVQTSLTDGSGYVRQSRTHRLYYRLFAVAPYAQLLAVQDLASREAHQVVGSANVGGCTGTGTGCDPNAPNAADDTSLDAIMTCVPSATGSGVCGTTEGNTLSVSTMSNTKESNPEAASVPSGP